MNSSILHRLCAFALTLVVALPIAPRELVVLCFGADGHVAFESASELSREETGVDRGEEDAFCSDVCGPCTDVQLIAGAEASGRPSNGTSVLDPLSTVAVPSWSVGPPFTHDPLRRALLQLAGHHGGISPRALVALLI